MNNRCERMRERIEDSIGRALGADEQAALDLHCAECESCREYREQLIDDHSRLDRFAALHSTSEQRFEERTIEMLPVEAPMQAQRQRFRAAFARVPRAMRVAAAVAAAIVVIAGIDLLRGVHYGSVPAFASVLEKMEGANNVVEQLRRWNRGLWTTETRTENKEGSRRREDARGILIFSRNRYLSLYPAEKRAVITDFGSKSWRAPEGNLVDRIASYHKRKEFSFVRRERYMGKNAASYELRIGKNYRWVTWVDLDTGLPFRIEIYDPPFAKPGSLYPYGLKLSDFLPAGTGTSEAIGWTDLRPGEPAMVEDLTWNVPLDTSYFSLTPPAGYTVTKSDSAMGFYILKAGTEREMREGIPYEVSEITQAFSVWLSLSGGIFPDNVYDLADSSKARPLFIARHGKGGSPGDELRAAIMDALKLKKGFDILRDYDRAGKLHYLGKGVAFGDSTKIVCWAELYGRDRKRFKHPYWLIYADLHCAPSLKPPKIPKE
jgi:hypothetical protein